MKIFGQHLAAIIARKAVRFASHYQPSKLNYSQIEAVVTTLIKRQIMPFARIKSQLQSHYFLPIVKQSRALKEVSPQEKFCFQQKKGMLH